MIRHAQDIATEGRILSSLSHKNEEGRQLNRQGEDVGGSGIEGTYGGGGGGGCRYIVDDINQHKMKNLQIDFFM